MKSIHQKNIFDIITKYNISLVLFLSCLILSPVFVSSNNFEIKEMIGNPNIKLKGEYFDGYNLFVLERRNLDTQLSVDKTLLIVDMEGNTFLEKDLGTDAFLGAEFINSTTILLGKNAGAALWNIETDEYVQMSFHGHHDYEFNKENNTFFTLNIYFLEHEGTIYAFDRIEEYTPEGELIWNVNTSDFISFNQWCPFEDLDFDGKADITHSNSIFYDEDLDVLYLNCRNTNTFYKIDHKTGELIWALGEYGEFSLFDIYGNQKDCLFYHGHALEKINNNTFIYFDNDAHNQTNALNFHSRIIEITINEETMVAQITWKWEAPKDYFSAWWGDSDVLPNRNRVGTFGTHDHEGSTILGARLVEVDASGKIVWEMNFPRDGDISHGVYIMDRIQFSPIINIDDTYWSKSGEKAKINFQAWYNFRNKYSMNGSFSIYLNGTKIEKKEFKFVKYWQPTNLSTNLGILNDGNYNLTIILEDEGNHQTIKEVELVISKKPPITKTSGFQLTVIFPIIFVISILNKNLIKRRKL
jgi:hypothetical protein